MTAMSSGPKLTIDLSTTSSWSRTTSRAKSRARCGRRSTDAFGLDRQLHFIAREYPVTRHAERRALHVRRRDERAALVALAVAVVVGYVECDGPRDAEQGQLAFDPRRPASGKYDVLRLVGDLGMHGRVQQRRAAHELRSRLGVRFERTGVDHDVDLAALFSGVQCHRSRRAAELAALGGTQAAHLEGDERAAGIEREFGCAGIRMPEDGRERDETCDPTVSSEHGRSIARSGPRLLSTH